MTIDPTQTVTRNKVNGKEKPELQGTMLIHPLALRDMARSKLEQAFAGVWVDMYPQIPLMTQVPFAWSERTMERRGKLRADFSWDDGKRFTFIGDQPDLFLAPPCVLIECDGGVHRIKFDEDRHKEDVAYRLGFKLFRLTSERIYDGSPWIHDIAKAIKELS